MSLAACSGGTSLESGAARFEIQEDGARLVFLRDDEERLVLPADAFELGIAGRLDDDQSYDPYWLVTDDPLAPAPPPDLRFRAVSMRTVSKDPLTLELSFEGGRTGVVEFTSPRDEQFSLLFKPDDATGIAYLRVRLDAPADERYYGLGGHLDSVELRGSLRSAQLEARTSLESGSNEMHVPVPLLIGTSGWGVFVESERYGVFDVAMSRSDRVEITYGTGDATAEGLLLQVFLPPEAIDATQSYFAHTGLPGLPADWVYGPLIWRDETDGQTEVEDDVRLIRELDLATSGYWIDRPYEAFVGQFEFEPANYTDPAAMIRTANDAGLRVAVWHVPYLDSDSQYFDEARNLRIFPPQTGLRLNGWGDPVDFTNPEAYAWWQDKLRYYTALGIEGYKLDYAEDLIPGIAGGRSDWEFFDGTDERLMHRRYTMLYHQIYDETLPEDGGFMLARAARWGEQTLGMVIWPGDLDADFSRFNEQVDDYRAVGGLPASVAYGLSLSVSGFPFYGADTGGYRHSPPDEETFIRWMQASSLSVIMQVGDSSSQTPWEYTPENGRSESTLNLYRSFARLHMRLFPYVWTLAHQLQDGGRPIIQPLGLRYPELGVHPSDVYLLGDDLLVAPVVERGQTQRKLHLPAGDWIQWFTGESFEGPGEITVAATLNELPLFQRAGSVIAMLRPTIDTLAPTVTSTIESYANDPGALWLRWVPGPAGEFTVFDGTTVTHSGDSGLELSVSRGSKFTGAVVVSVAFAGEPAMVSVDGAPATRVDTVNGTEAVASYAVGPRLQVVLPPGATQVMVR